MLHSATELDELQQMRDNVRRNVHALEVCWSCQCICECMVSIIDQGPPVWLCNACVPETAVTCKSLAQLAWPSA